MKVCAQSITTRRSRLSAMAPAESENSMMGRDVEACTNATSCADPDSEVISQDAPTACTSAPKFDDIEANQIALKIGTENGEGGLSGRISVPVGGVARMDALRSCYRCPRAVQTTRNQAPRLYQMTGCVRPSVTFTSPSGACSDGATSTQAQGAQVSVAKASRSGKPGIQRGEEVFSHIHSTRPAAA